MDLDGQQALKLTSLDQRCQHVQCFLFASKFLRSKFTGKMQQIHSGDQIVLVDVELRLQNLDNDRARLRENSLVPVDSPTR